MVDGMARTNEVVELTRKLGVARRVDFDIAGIHRQYVALAWRDGRIERISRGLYRLAGMPRNRHSRLIEICKRVPHGVICLQSALFYYGFLEDEPQQHCIAIDRKSWRPVISDWAVQFIRFSGATFTQGVVNLTLDGVAIRIYSPMKTIADLLKYRNRLGIELTNDALLGSVRTNQYNPYRLLHFARICRVEALARLYIRRVGSGREFEGRQARSLWSERL